MISNAEYWINDLSKNVRFFHDKLSQNTWRRASFAALEKRVLMSSFIVRKLANSNHISKAAYQFQVPLCAYRRRGKTSEQRNNTSILDTYKTDQPEFISKPLSYIVNQLMHSYELHFSLEGENTLCGVVFNSDKSKRKEIYLLRIDDLIKALSPIAQIRISSATYRINDEGGLEPE